MHIFVRWKLYKTKTNLRPHFHGNVLWLVHIIGSNGPFDCPPLSSARCRRPAFQPLVTVNNGFPDRRTQTIDPRTKPRAILGLRSSVRGSTKGLEHAKGVRDISVFPIRVFMLFFPFRTQSFFVQPLVRPRLAACTPASRACRLVAHRFRKKMSLTPLVHALE